MKRVCRSWTVVVVGALVIGACATPPEPTDASRAQVIRLELEGLLSDGEPQRVIPRVTALRDEEIIPASELDRYFELSVARIIQQFDDAMESAEYGAALSAWHSLRALGIEPSGNEDASALESSLLAGKAEALFDEGNSAAALAVLLQAPSPGLLSAQLLELGIDAAMSLNNRAAAAVLADALEPQGNLQEEIRLFLSGRELPVEMLDGVVTVLVNRGLRLEGGVGIPDRVIGSGFFVDPRGYIITNYHVIESEVDPEYEGYSRLHVRLRGDRATRVPARVVGFSPVFDIALLKVELNAPYVFSFSDARELRPGASIVAIGSPGGLENSISSGVISATGRRFLQMGETMQIDVPINPGNSGGPLLDENGQLVGVVFAGIEQFEGVNFAIPAYWINRFLPLLYEPGAVPHPWFGVAVEQHDEGLEVIYVVLGSPAEQAGLRVGDVVTSINGVEVSTVPEAHDLLLERSPGTLIRLDLERAGGRQSVYAALTERPRRPVVDALDNDLRERLYPVLYGMRVERSGRDFFRQVYTVNRVYRGTTADEIGISTGDRFTELGFDLISESQVVLLQMFIQKRTDGFMRTNIQIPAFSERDNFL